MWPYLSTGFSGDAAVRCPTRDGILLIALFTGDYGNRRRMESPDVFWYTACAQIR